jgi:hypothetical protein
MPSGDQTNEMLNITDMKVNIKNLHKIICGIHVCLLTKNKQLHIFKYPSSVIIDNVIRCASGDSHTLYLKYA